MDKPLIYLAGCMTYYWNKNEYHKATDWRSRLRNMWDLDAIVFDPTTDEWANMSNDMYQGFGYDTWMVRHSTVLLVNFQDADAHSVGTDMELMLAYENKVPIIAINQTGQELHPWINRVVQNEFKTEEQAVQYINSHYIYLD